MKMLVLELQLLPLVMSLCLKIPVLDLQLLLLVLLKLCAVTVLLKRQM
jgi:hypothetical protein